VGAAASPTVQENFLAQKQKGVTLKSNSFIKHGSPHWLTERIFSITFQLEEKPLKPQKPPRTYRNPIYVAKEYAQMLESGRAKSKSDIGRKLNISRVRVWQYLRLLKLNASLIKSMEQLGDPLTKQVITERFLRPYLLKSHKKQKKLANRLRAMSF